MTLRTLIRRSLRFHWRAHLGVVLGAAVGSAALIGALVVGDSVRESLRERALTRIGTTEFLLAATDRFFSDSTNTWSKALGESYALGLRLPAVATVPSGASRANSANVYGVTENFWRFALEEVRDDLAAGSVFLNASLAAQLAVGPGDQVILRVPKPSALSRDMPVAPQEDVSLALRLKVQRILGPQQFGDFSGRAGQSPPFNAFMRLEELQQAAHMTNKANLVLQSGLENWFPKPFAGSRGWISDRLADVGVRVPAWLVPWQRRSLLPKYAPRELSNLLRETWSAADAELVLAVLEPPGLVELRSPRVFLDEPMVRVATSLAPVVYDQRRLAAPATPVTNAQSILTYLVNLFRAGTNTTPYSIVTAAGPPWTPPEMRDNEILLNQWLADDLRVAPGDTIELTYFLPESGARLIEATNRFRVRAVVPLEGPHADRTLMPEFPGLAKAESTHDWDAGFPLVHKIRDKDEAYWKQYRGTPKAFVTLAAGQEMWANRFGNLTAIRFPVPTHEVGRAVLDPAKPHPTPGRARLPSSPDLASQNIGARRESRPPGEDVLVGADLDKLRSNAPQSRPLDGAVGTPRPTNVVEAYRAALEKNILANLRPEDVGLRFEPVRDQALKAANEAQDFGQLFLGFSFFLIAAALILMALLFQFGLEQRVTEVGTFLALGFTPRQVRRLFLGEGVALAALGGVLGVAAGLGYAWAMLRGLTTIWRAAVNASALDFHASLGTLGIGAVASVAVSGFTIWLTLRKLARQPARELLVGEGSEGMGLRSPSPRPSPPGRGNLGTQPGIDLTASLCPNAECRSPSPGGEGRGEGEPTLQSSSPSASHASRPPGVRRALTSAATVGWTSLAAAGLLLAWAVATGDTRNAGVFFGAGSLLLVAGLAFTARLLRRWASAESQRRFTLRSLGFRGATRRRNRSLAVAGLLACGSFLIVAIGAFKLDANQDAGRRSSGTGGFALIGESTLPIIRDLNTKEGRDFYGLDEAALAGVSFVPMRVRDGDDASCLNLNRAQRPRLLGVKPELLAERSAFTLAKLAKNGTGPTNGWQLLHAAFRIPHSAIEIPAIGDAASIQWAMGKKLGETLDYVDERGQPFTVRLTGAVANSILQGSLLIDEEEFKGRFPGESGYRMFLIDAPSNRVAEVSATLSRAFQDAGLELTPATRRLAQFNAVQNTYLNTFQVLGGLGLLLGTAGLGVVVLRNVLERRGELALLLAVGFRQRGLRRLVLSEHGALLGLGLAIGMVAALTAILPTLLSPGAEVPTRSLTVTLAGLLASGMLWTWLATWLALRGRLLAALRNE